MYVVQIHNTGIKIFIIKPLFILIKGFVNLCIFITPSDIDRKFFLTLKEFEEQQTLKHFNVMRIIMFKSFEPGEMKIVVRRDTIIESMW